VKITELKDSWIFIKDENKVYKGDEIAGGEVITIPHCFNAVDGQSGNGMFKDNCCYQKKMILNQEELSQYHYLEIGAASLVSEVYVNGSLAGSSRNGFSMFRVFLNPYLKEGDNLISIYVDNSRKEDVYPLMADFSFYGGLYREVKWITASHLHFDLMDHSLDGIYLTQKSLGSNTFELQVSGKIIHELAEKTDCEISITLLDKNKNIVMSRIEKCTVVDEIKWQVTEIIDNPQLWQGIEDPYLYEAHVKLCKNHEMLEERILEIGFRTIEITPDKGVFLNGKPIKFNGVSRHQDFAGVGNALTKAEMELDLKLIQEIGANTIRLSHYQHHDYFYTLCDRAGLLVWAEIPFISVPTTADKENKNAKEQLECLIKQAYNHSSIYCWGVQNEITIAIENEQIYDLVQELADLARQLDHSRVITQANIHSVANESKLNEITDLVGYNLYYGWYYKEMKELGSRLDDFHTARPDIPVMVTEYGVDTNPNYHSYDPTVKDYTEEYQLLFQDNALKTFRERDFVLGGYVWSMFDFGSEIRNEGGVKGKNQKGLVTIDRKLKKDSFYLCKAYWSKEKFVKLAGSRFVNRHKEFNDIVILSNIENNKLYVNGAFVSEVNHKEPMKTIHFVPLKPGENKILVEAIDVDGKHYRDEMVLILTKEKDPNYVIQKVEDKTTVTNWFQKFDLSNVQEIALKDGYYSTFDTIEELYKQEEAKAVFQKYFSDLAENPQMQAMRGLMTIDSMSKRSRFNIPKELLTVINRELNEIKKVN
jgi:beta-galactosidase